MQTVDYPSFKLVIVGGGGIDAADRVGEVLKILRGYRLIDRKALHEFFYPRNHLDQSSLLCRTPLLAKPMVMDVYQDHILVTYRPFDVLIFHVKLFGELTPHNNPDL